jgi:arylformamidase
MAACARKHDRKPYQGAQNQIKTPLFGTNPPNVFKQIESVRKSDHCNSTLITFFSHNGTHMDAPRHFDEKGKKIVDHRIEDFIFEKPRLIEVPKEEDGAIGLSDLLEHKREIQSSDLLLIRTGFGRKRGKKSYIKNNPWIDPDAAMFLRKQGNLKAIGIDAISISSFQHLEIGEETHRILLRRDLDLSKPKLIIEDLNLSVNLRGLKRVFATPFITERADGAPCTVFAEVKCEQG